MLERLVINERKHDEIIRDRVFYSLVQVMINDYFRIQEEYKDYIPYEVGREFTTHLHGALILLEPSKEEIKNYCRKIKYFRPIHIWDENFIKKLEKNLEDDGARVIKDNKLILKAGVYAHHQAEKEEGAEITEIIEKYTRFSAKFIGERLTAALAFSIAAKKYSCILSQTIQQTPKEIMIEGKNYSRIGTGKVAEYGAKGLVRTVKLENGDENIPKNHLLDKDVYIKQYNYELNKRVQLASMKYVTLEDLTFLSSEKIFSEESI